MKSKVLFILAAICAFNASAQPKTGTLMVTNTSPEYLLSPDGKTLCVHETNDNRDKWGIFLNLDNYTWQSQGTLSIRYSNVVLAPDQKSIYGNAVDDEGYKGDADWVKYRKYMSWYYPDCRNAGNKIQWPDKYFILGQRPDGNLLVAAKLTVKKVKGLMYPKMNAAELCIINPANGEVVQTLRTFGKGQEFKIRDSWINPTGFFLNEGNLLVWPSAFNDFTTLRPADGEVLYFKPPVSLTAFSGKYGMGQDKEYVDNKYIIHKVVVNMENGQVVYDQKRPVGNAPGCWSAAWGKFFYTLDGATSMLRKEEWTGSELKLLDSVKLDINGALANDTWGNLTRYNYKLVVAEPAGKVMMLPVNWSQDVRPSEALFFWTLNNGQLAFVNPAFIQPSSAYLAKINRPRLNSIPFNVLVKTYNGLYVVLDQNQTTKKWSVIKFVKDRHGNYERINKEEDAFAFIPVATDVVSANACARCNNSGMMATVSRVTTEKTDKMIYNQITTTTTKDVIGKSICSDCKGLGFSVR